MVSYEDPWRAIPLQKTVHLLAKHSPYKTPYFILQGDKDGPVCMVTAGIHGKEIASIFAAKQFEKLEIQKGTLLVIPLVHKAAFLKRIRGNPDLNRTFPRQSNDPPRHSLAKEVIQVTKCFRPTWCLDLHEATGFSKLNRKKLGQSLICYPDELTVKTANRVASKVNQNIFMPHEHFTVQSGVLPGSFRTAAARLINSHSIVVETSMNLPLSTRVHYQKIIVERFLEEVGLL